MILEKLETDNQATIKYFLEDLSRYYDGRPTPMLLDGVKVKYYDQWVPLEQASTITVQGYKALIVIPFDRGMVKDIERAIHKANLGLTPQADSEVVKVYLPSRTKESDIKIFKIIKERAETARVAIRYNRQQARSSLDKDKSVTEDERRSLEKKIQKQTDDFIKQINDILENKRIALKV